MRFIQKILQHNQTIKDLLKAQDILHTRIKRANIAPNLVGPLVYPPDPNMTQGKRVRKSGTIDCSSTTPFACHYIRGSVCLHAKNQCACAEGMRPYVDFDTKILVCDRTRIGEACQTDRECYKAIGHSECVKNACACQTNYTKYYHKQPDRFECIHLYVHGDSTVILGGLCISDRNCTVEHSVCAYIHYPYNGEVKARRICQCDPAYVMTSNLNFCRPKRYLESCTNDYECPEMLYDDGTGKASTCLKLRCDCKIGYQGNVHNNYCKRNILNDPCLRDSDCTIPNSECSRNSRILYVLMTCKCKKGFVYSNSKTCIVGSLTLPCASDEMCKARDVHSRCDIVSKKCHCKTGSKFNMDKTQCLQVKYGDSCLSNNDCVSCNDFDLCSRTLNCVEGHCSCKIDQHRLGSTNHCIDNNLGSECNLDKVCKVVGSQCLDGKCSCPHGQIARDKFSCMQKTLMYSCKVNADCYIEHSECELKVCQCKARYQHSLDLMTCTLRQYNSRCSLDMHCGDPYVCLWNKCSCPLDQKVVVRGVQNVCESNVIGDTCQLDEQCGSSFICRSERCDCIVGKGITSTTTCNVKKLMDICQNNLECTAIDTNSICKNNICICQKLFSMKNEQTCVKRSLGDGCQIKQDCSSIFPGSECFRGKCACVSTWIQKSPQSCQKLETIKTTKDPCKNNGLYVYVNRVPTCICLDDYKGEKCEYKNVAKNKLVTSSNTIKNGAAKNVVNGDLILNNVLLNECLLITEPRKYIHFGVDLNKVYNIHSVNIVFGICETCDKSYLEMNVASYDRASWTIGFKVFKITSKCSKVDIEYKERKNVEVLCEDDFKGRYIFVYRERELAICEFQVFPDIVTPIPPPKPKNNTISKVTPIIKVDQSCIADLDCSPAVTHKLCDKTYRRCVCIDHYREINGYCVTRKYGDKCEKLSDCDGTPLLICKCFTTPPPNIPCALHTCQCQSNAVDRLNSAGVAVSCMIRELGIPCYYNLNCTYIEHTICVNDTCQCATNVYGGFVASKDNSRCLKRFLGDDCNNYSNCSMIANSFCNKTSRVCECEPGHDISHDNSLCIKRILGDFCILTSDCRHIEMAKCEDMICVCPLFYQPHYTNTYCAFSIIIRGDIVLSLTVFALSILYLCYHMWRKYKKPPLLTTKFVDETPPKTVAQNEEEEDEIQEPVENSNFMDDVGNATNTLGEYAQCLIGDNKDYLGATLAHYNRPSNPLKHVISNPYANKNN